MEDDALPSARQRPGDDRRRAAALSEAGARSVRIRNRCRRDAAGQRGQDRHARAPARAHPQHQEAAARRRVDHERAAHRQQPGDDAADSARGVPGRRRGVGPRARLPRASLSRRDVRHHLRPEHDLDSVVRRRVGDGRSAQPGAPLPAALRHGARVGEGDAAAGRAVCRDHLPHHDPVPGRRRRAGRRLRHRRPGPDDVGRRRRDAARAVVGAARRLRLHHARLRLHHAAQHLRTAGRHQDRRRGSSPRSSSRR